MTVMLQLSHLFLCLIISDKFDYKELEEADAIFAPIIFVSFTFIVTFGLVNFMITIILEGFAEVQVRSYIWFRNSSKTSILAVQNVLAVVSKNF